MIIDGKVYNNWPRIQVDETLRETVPHGSEDFAFKYYCEDIWQFDSHCADWHWHPEVEFFYMRKGNAVLCAGSDKIEIEEGFGIR